jgi:mannose-6-phosphate isomerase-like protein (cupin superfamily)
MDTKPAAHTIELGRETIIHFGDDLTLTPLRADPSFWTHTDSHRPELAEGRIMCAGDYTSTWTWWERHPDGDELVMVLSGTAEFVLEDDDDTRTVSLGAGQSTIVPAGTWHRAVVDDPCRMLFVTPTPAGTQVRPV